MEAGAARAKHRLLWDRTVHGWRSQVHKGNTRMGRGQTSASKGARCAPSRLRTCTQHMARTRVGVMMHTWAQSALAGEGRLLCFARAAPASTAAPSTHPCLHTQSHASSASGSVLLWLHLEVEGSRVDRWP